MSIFSTTQKIGDIEDGCTSYGLTFDLLQELEADLFQHIHLENNILFKQLVS